jgi:hypothetical protein
VQFTENRFHQHAESPAAIPSWAQILSKAAQYSRFSRNDWVCSGVISNVQPLVTRIIAAAAIAIQLTEGQPEQIASAQCTIRNMRHYTDASVISDQSRVPLQNAVLHQPAFGFDKRRARQIF